MTKQEIESVELALERARAEARMYGRMIDETKRSGTKAGYVEKQRAATARVSELIERKGELQGVAG